MSVKQSSDVPRAEFAIAKFSHHDFKLCPSADFYSEVHRRATLEAPSFVTELEPTTSASLVSPSVVDRFEIVVSTADAVGDATHVCQMSVRQNRKAANKESRNPVRALKKHSLQSVPGLQYVFCDVVCCRVPNSESRVAQEVVRWLLEWAQMGNSFVLNAAVKPALLVIGAGISLFDGDSPDCKSVYTDTSFDSPLPARNSLLYPLRSYFSGIHVTSEEFVDDMVVRVAARTRARKRDAGQLLTWTLFARSWTLAIQACNERRPFNLLSLPPQPNDVRDCVNRRVLCTSGLRKLPAPLSFVNDVQSPTSPSSPTIPALAELPKRLASYLISFYDRIEEQFGCAVAVKMLHDRIRDTPFIWSLRSSALGMATGPGCIFPGPWETVLRNYLEPYVTRKVQLYNLHELKEHADPTQRTFLSGVVEGMVDEAEALDIMTDFLFSSPPHTPEPSSTHTSCASGLNHLGETAATQQHDTDLPTATLVGGSTSTTPLPATTQSAASSGSPNKDVFVDVDTESETSASSTHLMDPHTTVQLWDTLNRQLQQYLTWDPASIYQFHHNLLLQHHHDLVSLASCTEVCFACLHETPTKVLPCDHILCRPCWELMHVGTSTDLGEHSSVDDDSNNGSNHVDDHNNQQHRQCPLCQAECALGRVPKPACLVDQTDVNVGYRVLALDGGGIRGLVQLTTLSEIERVLGLTIKDLVDFIIGTSTGGVITAQIASSWLPSATAGVTRTKEAMYAAFGTPNTAVQVPGIGLLLHYFNVTKYDVTPFHQYLYKIFGDKELLQSAEPHMYYGITACVDEDGFPGVLFASYNRPVEWPLPDFLLHDRHGDPYHHHHHHHHSHHQHHSRDDIANSNGNLDALTRHSSTGSNGSTTSSSASAHKHVMQDPIGRLGRNRRYTIVDAVRSTSAAAFFFPPYVTNGKVFTDGGLRHNNPSDLALEETARLWPHRHCDVILSLGTGTGAKPQEQDMNHQNDIVKLCAHIINLVTSGQGIWDRVLTQVLPESEQRAFRLDPVCPRKVPFNDVESVESGEIAAFTLQYFQSAVGRELLHCSCARLFACLFFIDEVRVTSQDCYSSNCSGNSSNNESSAAADEEVISFVIRSRCVIPWASRAFLLCFHGLVEGHADVEVKIDLRPDFLMVSEVDKQHQDEQHMHEMESVGLPGSGSASASASSANTPSISYADTHTERPVVATGTISCLPRHRPLMLRVSAAVAVQDTLLTSPISGMPCLLHSWPYYN